MTLRVALCALLFSSSVWAAGLTEADAQQAALKLQPGTAMSAVAATVHGKPVWVVPIEHDGTVSEVLIDTASGAKVDGPPDPPAPVEATPAPDC